MFCWIFPPSPECLICYATSKNPIISLSYAYGCLCHTSHAHTHCLTRLTKCPTCRKRVTTPKLRVDHWIHRALDWIKDNSAIYRRGVRCVWISCVVIYGIGFAETHGFLSLHPYLKNVCVGCLIVAHVVFFVDMCVNNHWKYDEKLQKYY